MPKHEYLSVNTLELTGAMIGAGLTDVLLPPTTGNRWYVDDSGVDAGGSRGKTKSGPFKTIDYTIGKATADQGDQIIVMPGHAETLTAKIAVDVAGLTFIGLGHGDKRPTLTVNGAFRGLNVSAANSKFVNLRFVAGSSITAAASLAVIAASNVTFIGCQFEMAYDMYNMIRIDSGDDIKFINCVFENTVSTNASLHPQSAIVNRGGTNVLVYGCRFIDFEAKKTERWRTCVRGGKLTASLTVEECTFVCRGIATATRSAAASGIMNTVFCRAISPSGNTAVGALFTPTYQYIIESYNVAAVNKVGVVTVTTSDKRMKTNIKYLDEYRLAA